MKRLLFLLLALLLVPAAWAQGQRFVTSSTPATGTASVALNTTVSFTFNDAISLDAAEDLVTVVSESVVTVTGVARSGDGRTITYTVEHQDDADVYWLVYGTYFDEDGNATGVPLPYILYYTTAETAASLTVSGVATPASAEVENTGAVVVLIDRNPFGAEGGLEAAVVKGVGIALPNTGTFTVRHVRAGTLWPVATNVTSIEIEDDDVFNGDLFSGLIVGFHDPDADRQPDPVTVTADVSGLPLALYTLSSFAGTSAEAQATAAGSGVAGDLAAISAFGVTPEGRSVVWSFTYYEAGADSAAMVSVFPFLGASVEYLAYDPDFDDFAPLPDAYVGSEVALATAEANGGADFRAEYEGALVTAEAGSGARAMLEGTPYEGTEAWVVTYLYFDLETFEFATLTIIVDLETGAFIDAISEDGEASTLAGLLEGARDLAAQFGEDFQLIGFEATEVDAGGAAASWTFQFYSEGTDALFVVTLDAAGTPEFELIPTPGLADTRALPETFVDSDVAFEAALEAGGTAFFETYDEVAVGVRGGYVPDFGAAIGDSAVYVITFTDVSAQGDDTFIAVVSLRTGAVLDTRTSVAAESDVKVPATIALAANYPNPFNPSTVIPFTLQKPGAVRLSVYDALGREVARLVDETRPAGAHTATWNAEGLPSGVYLYRLEAGGERLTRTMTLVK